MTYWENEWANDWTPTHEVYVEHALDPVRVMFVNEGNGGPAFTYEEWLAFDKADIEADWRGLWMFQGDPGAVLQVISLNTKESQ